MNDAEEGQMTAYALGEAGAEEQALVEERLRREPGLQVEIEQMRAFTASVAGALATEPIPELSTSSPTSSGGSGSGSRQGFRARPRTGPETPGAFRYAIHRMRLDWMALSPVVRWSFPLAASLALGIGIGRHWPRIEIHNTPVAPPTAVAVPAAPAPQFPLDFTFKSPEIPPLFFQTDWASYNWARYDPARVQPVILRSAPSDVKVRNLLLVRKPGEKLPPRADLLMDPKATALLIDAKASSATLHNQPPAREPAPPPAPEPAPAW